MRYSYKITVVTDGKEYPLYLPGSDDLQLIDPVLAQELNVSGGLTFDVPVTHPFKDMIKPLSSEFYVYQNGVEIFRGRNMGSEEDFSRTGSIECEGDLAYLLDSIQRPYDRTGTVEDFFTAVLETHNQQVEERKRFEKGTVNVVGGTPETQRATDACSTTLNCLKAELIGPYKGYLRTRRGADGKRYLDYMIDYGGYNKQPLRFRENLLDIGKRKDATTVRTALIPYGAQKEVENEDGTTRTERLTIKSVNNDVDYVYDEKAVSEYGWIWDSKTWDDVTDPTSLLEAARDYLNEAVKLPEVLELTAVDLSLIDAETAALDIGYWTRVTSEPHGLKGDYLLTQKTMHLTEPEKDTIVLGGEIPTLTGSITKGMADMGQKVQDTSRQTRTELTNKINNATKLITGGLGGYVVLDVIDPETGKQMHPWRILFMDAPDKDVARNVIQINKNGIGFSTTGINGPYRNAWTIDGNLVADFITVGQMLADRIRGGILEVGGQGLARDGKIVVKDAQDHQIGYWDKTGLHVLRGEIEGSSFYGGSISVGPFSADDGGVYFGDYYVSADGSNQLLSNNKWVAINTNERPSGSPGGKYASLFIGGAGYSGVTLEGTGQINCGGIKCDRVVANDCNLSQGSSRRWGLGETIDWFWNEFQELKNRVDNL